jgi:hypothetical protein
MKCYIQMEVRVVRKKEKRVKGDGRTHFLPIKSFPSMRASRSAFRAAAFSAIPAIIFKETASRLLACRLLVRAPLKSDGPVQWLITEYEVETE